MRLVSRTVAYIAMATLLAACSLAPGKGRTPDSPKQQEVIQAQVDKLTREVAVKLATLGELKLLLKPTASDVREQRAGMQRVLYAESGEGSGPLLGGLDELPDACRLYQTFDALQLCCPTCSEATIRNAMGYPNKVKALNSFSGGVAVVIEAVAGDSSLIVEEIKDQRQQP